MCVYVLSAICISVPHVCLVPEEAREDIRSRTGVPEGGEPPCGCWEESPGPVQEQPVLSSPLSSLLTDSFISF